MITVNLCQLISGMDDNALEAWLLSVRDEEVTLHFPACGSCLQRIQPLLERYHDAMCNVLTEATAEQLLALFSNRELHSICELHLIYCTECCLRFLQPLEKAANVIRFELRERIKAQVDFVLLNAEQCIVH